MHVVQLSSFLLHLVAQTVALLQCELPWFAVDMTNTARITQLLTAETKKTHSCRGAAITTFKAIFAVRQEAREQSKALTSMKQPEQSGNNFPALPTPISLPVNSCEKLCYWIRTFMDICSYS